MTTYNIHFGKPSTSSLGGWVMVGVLAVVVMTYEAAPYVDDLIISRSIKGLIGKAESPQWGYDDYNRGTLLCNKKYKRNKQPISKLTLREIMSRQTIECGEQKLLAVGWYQIVPTTLSEAVNYLGINKDSVFDAKLQDYIFSQYLAKIKRVAINHYLTTGEGIELALDEMALEWASVANRNGATNYKHNRVTVSRSRTKKTLIESRKLFTQVIQHHDPDTAWLICLGLRNGSVTI